MLVWGDFGEDRKRSVKNKRYNRWEGCSEIGGARLFFTPSSPKLISTNWGEN